MFKRSKILLCCGAVLVVAIALFGAACTDKARKRPFGYMRVGAVSDLLSEATLLDREALLVRRDERGFFVMSTMCTRDLANLKRVVEGGKISFVCPHDNSIFDRHGNVLQGPARANLPYFKLELDAGKFDGPKDTLYARIADEVLPEWRLPVDVSGISEQE